MAIPAGAVGPPARPAGSNESPAVPPAAAALGSGAAVVGGENPGGTERLSIPHVLAEVLEGLRFLHARGISHRDIKPASIFPSFILFGIPCVHPASANIFFSVDGHVKLGDFGLSTFVSECLRSPGTIDPISTVSLLSSSLTSALLRQEEEEAGGGHGGGSLGTTDGVGFRMVMAPPPPPPAPAAESDAGRGYHRMPPPLGASVMGSPGDAGGGYHRMPPPALAASPLRSPAIGLARNLFQAMTTSLFDDIPPTPASSTPPTTPPTHPAAPSGFLKPPAHPHTPPRRGTISGGAPVPPRPLAHVQSHPGSTTRPPATGFLTQGTAAAKGSGLVVGSARPGVGILGVGAGDKGMRIGGGRVPATWQEEDSEEGGTFAYSAPTDRPLDIDHPDGSVPLGAPKKPNEKYDVFSLGVVLFELLHGPFSTKMERTALLEELRRGHIDESILTAAGDRSNPGCTHLLRLMIQSNNCSPPEQHRAPSRPSSDRDLNRSAHPFPHAASSPFDLPVRVKQLPRHDAWRIIPSQRQPISTALPCPTPYNRKDPCLFRGVSVLASNGKLTPNKEVRPLTSLPHALHAIHSPPRSAPPHSPAPPLESIVFWCSQ
ncbi:hypothetical protein PAPYR_10487 [Paratrimastix pyriformis]|uniref:Protein kinase domain-containing protein n=1 Tax=Paratrimastix pyriformis TaxID=342808 RepID=A0ABQ8UAT8_9EUKA|nr:hypothetical protein PAPYR_10487 [Paratrimastix pyriformis]